MVITIERLKNQIEVALTLVADDKGWLSGDLGWPRVASDESEGICACIVQRVMAAAVLAEVSF